MLGLPAPTRAGEECGVDGDGGFQGGFCVNISAVRRFCCGCSGLCTLRRRARCSQPVRKEYSSCPGTDGQDLMFGLRSDDPEPVPCMKCKLHFTCEICSNSTGTILIQFLSGKGDSELHRRHDMHLSWLDNSSGFDPKGVRNEAEIASYLPTWMEERKRKAMLPATNSSPILHVPQRAHSDWLLFHSCQYCPDVHYFSFLNF